MENSIDFSFQPPEDDEKKRQAEQEKQARAEAAKAEREAQRAEKASEKEAKEQERVEKRERAEQAYRERQHELKQEKADAVVVANDEKKELDPDDQQATQEDVDGQELAPEESDLVELAKEHAISRSEQIDEEISELESEEDRVTQAGVFAGATYARNIINRLRRSETASDVKEATSEAEGETLAELTLPHTLELPEDDLVVEHDVPNEPLAPRVNEAAAPNISSIENEEPVDDLVVEPGSGSAATAEQTFDAAPNAAAEQTSDAVPNAAVATEVPDSIADLAVGGGSELGGFNNDRGQLTDPLESRPPDPVAQPESLPRKPSVAERGVGATLAGSLLGFLFGRSSTSGAEKEVKKLKKEVKELRGQQEEHVAEPHPKSKEVSRPKEKVSSHEPQMPRATKETIVQNIDRGEQKVRRIASNEIAKQPNKTQAERIEKLKKTVEEKAPEASAARQSLRQEIDQKSSSKEFIASAETANAVYEQSRADRKNPQYWTMREVLQAASAIPVRGESLKEMFQRGYVSERGMRTIVELQARGYDVRRQISEVLNTERHEMLRSQPPAQAIMLDPQGDQSNGGNNFEAINDVQSNSSNGVGNNTGNNSGDSQQAGAGQLLKIGSSALSGLALIVFVVTIIILLALFG